jgi:heme/copper-type cytochrome/quinol oxidase subunit 2
MMRSPRKVQVALAVAVVVAVGAFWAGGSASSRGQVREITVTGDQFAFSPARIEVQKDDLVQVRFTAKDIAHSFTVDLPYRISKRAGAGQSVVFEFRADEAGRFTFYCNLTQDERCKQMRGELVVR